MEKLVAFGVLTNTFAIYPTSVKIVRKLFRLTGFWNIHFAILPIIFNWNAFVLGFCEGAYIYYKIQSSK